MSVPIAANLFALTFPADVTSSCALTCKENVHATKSTALTMILFHSAKHY